MKTKTISFLKYNHSRAKVLFAFVSLFVVTGLTAAEPEFSEDFASYTAGETLQSQSPWDASFTTGSGTNIVINKDSVSPENCVALIAPSYANEDSVSLRRFTNLILDGDIVFTTSVKLLSEAGEEGHGSGSIFFGGLDSTTGVQVVFNGAGKVFVVDRDRDAVQVGEYSLDKWYTLRLTVHIDPANGLNSQFGIDIPELHISEGGFFPKGDCTAIGGFIELGAHGFSAEGLHGGNANNVEFRVDSISITREVIKKENTVKPK